MWRMEELVRQTQRLIDVLPEGDSKRVRWLPNERLLRYYTTLGLLDRPAAIKGRTAYYHLRHLLQVLAIKTLQTRGLSLQEVQQQLTGRSESQLVELIGLPDDYLARLEPGSEPTPLPVKRFWERAPVEAPPLETFALQGLELAPGVQLTFDASLYPGLDPHQVRLAAAKLMELFQNSMEDNR